jgi:hypothetical protein
MAYEGRELWHPDMPHMRSQHERLRSWYEFGGHFIQSGYAGDDETKDDDSEDEDSEDEHAEDYEFKDDDLAGSGFKPDVPSKTTPSVRHSVGGKRKRSVEHSPERVQPQEMQNKRTPAYRGKRIRTDGNGCAKLTREEIQLRRSLWISRVPDSMLTQDQDDLCFRCMRQHPFAIR